MNSTSKHGVVVPALTPYMGEGASFDDRLYDWMNRAPWLAISAVAHILVILLFAVIPWHLFESIEPPVIQMLPAVIEEEPFIEPDIEDPTDVVEPEPSDEPTLNEAQLVEDPSVASDAFADTHSDEFAQFENDPFDAFASNDLIGVGGNAGGPGAGQFGRGSGGGPGGATRQTVADGLSWLVRHQDSDGGWDADEFMKHDPSTDICTGPGHAEHDVGVTGLALLALMGDGHTTRQGLYKKQVTQGVKWLREQQDFENGLLGDKVGTAFLYDHGIATLALCEAYYFSKSPIIRGSAQKAISFVTQARNPYGVWRYDVPPTGDNDSSVTGWMVFALKSAEESGLKLDSAAFNDAITWFDEMTDPSSGRVGYDSMGSLSARVPGLNDTYSAEASEAMTAVGLLCRFFLGQDPKQAKVMEKHADLLLRKLPEWSEDGQSNDMYYWYYGSYAMYQMGGKHWRAWNQAMKKAVVGSQRQEGSAKGSWDPNGPWGAVGGRVYSTAMMTLCLEVYYRYAKVLGGR